MSIPLHLGHDWFPRPLPDHVTLGERSWCYSAFAFLHCRSRTPRAVRIGHDTGIYNGTFFDLGPEADVEIGNFCTLVGAVLATNSRVVIKDYCFMAHEVTLADRFAAVPGPETDAGKADIVFEENCWVGMRAVIIGPVTIGEGAIIGAASVVTADVPPYAIVAGNPAVIVGWSRKPGGAGG